MQYVQLRAVHAVALHGGFSAAATALGLTQPAISDQVRKLEQDYGCVLFNRRGRHVEPTELGHRLLTCIRPMFDAEAQARALLAQSATMETGSLSIVADAPDLAISLIAAFRRAHPHVRVSLSIANADQCLARVNSAAVNLAVTAGMVVDSNLQTEVMREDRLMALVHKSHKLAAQKRLTLADLAQAGLIFREPRSITQRLLAAELQRQRLTCEPALHVDGREAMVEAVAANLGVGVIAASEYGGRRGVRMRPITGCTSTMTVALVASREQLGARLVAEMLALARSLGSEKIQS